MTAPSQRVWLVTCVALVFLIGASAGVLVDRAWLLRPPPGRPGPMNAGPPQGPPVERMLQDLDAALHLSADQRQRISGILEARMPRLRQLQDDARRQFNAEQKSLHQDIGAVLTPDQLKKFQEMVQANPGLGERGGPMGPGMRGGPGRPGGPPPGRGRRGGGE